MGFPPGQHVYVLRRRSETEMAVWLEDSPEQLVTVPLTKDRSRLVYKSFNGPADVLEERGKSAGKRIYGHSDGTCLTL